MSQSLGSRWSVSGRGWCRRRHTAPVPFEERGAHIGGAPCVGDLVGTVIANPLTLRNQPSPPVDLERAWRLMTDSVSVIRGY